MVTHLAPNIENTKLYSARYGQFRLVLFVDFRKLTDGLFDCKGPLKYTRAAVPNLGYMKYLKWFASSRITLRFSMKQLTSAHQWVCEFYFFLHGSTRTEKGWEPLHSSLLIVLFQLVCYKMLCLLSVSGLIVGDH